MNLRTISADSHITEPAGCYIDHIDPRFRDRAPVAADDDTMGAVMVIDNGRSRVPYGMVAAAGRDPSVIGPFVHVGWDELHPGGWDPVARLTEQDTDGVDAEVLYPSVGMLLCNHPDWDYKKACFDAYNRWITEFCSHAPERLIGLGQTTMRSPDEGIAELEAIAALGLRGAMMPGVPQLEDYDHEMYDPFWEAALDLGLPLSFHILTSGSDSLGAAHFRGPKMNSFLGIIRGNQDIIGTMIFGGVFERHPDLRIVCVEADAGWAPHWMYRADHAYDRHRNWLTTAPLTRRPSEWFSSNVALTFQDDWVAFAMADQMDPGMLMWANDHPHSDATWPNSQALLAEHTSALDEALRDRILWSNCAEMYGIAS